MDYFAGIDAGQSSTTAVIGAADGRVISRGGAGGCDELGARPDSTRLRDALEGALREALRVAQLPETTQLRALVAGISGYDAEPVGAAPRFTAEKTALMHDAPIAHAGAFGGGSGVVVIAGTGSVAYARDDRDETLTLGGLGYVFGDEGSAFAVSRDALAASLRAAHAHCAVAAQACKFFSQANVFDIIAAFYRGTISRDRLAAFAQIVVDISTTGADACAVRAVSDAQSALASLARDTRSQRGLHWNAPTRISFVGGLMRNDSFRAGVYSQPILLDASVRVIEPRYDAASGALLLAYRLGGIAVRELHSA